MLALLVGRHFWLIAYAMLAAGLWLPGDYTGLQWSVPFCLGGILYFTCLKIRLGEIGAALRPRMLLRVACLVPVRLLLLPTLCWAAARMVAPDWATGVLLLALMPPGFATIAFADLYGGNRMLALLLVLTASLACPFTVPLLLQWLGHDGSITAGALAGRIAYLLVLLTTPFALAQVTRAVAPGLVERHMHQWTYGSILCSCVMVFVSIAANRSAWAGMPLSGLLLPLALGTMCCVIGFAGSTLARRILGRADGIAFTCTEIWINNGLAIAFASQFFKNDPHMLLPAALMQVPIVAIMSGYGFYVRRSAFGVRSQEEPEGARSA